MWDFHWRFPSLQEDRLKTYIIIVNKCWLLANNDLRALPLWSRYFWLYVRRISDSLYSLSCWAIFILKKSRKMTSAFKFTRLRNCIVGKIWMLYNKSFDSMFKSIRFACWGEFRIRNNSWMILVPYLQIF